MAPGIDDSMDAHLADVALRSGLPTAENTDELERDCLPKKLNRSKMKNKQFNRLILENDAAMMAISKCSV